MNIESHSAARLRCQSQLPLALTVVIGAAGIVIDCISLYATPEKIVEAFGIGALLALLTWKLRAATPPAAALGGFCTSALYLATPGLHTVLWPLLALLLLTMTATRFGRTRKQGMGVAENPHGRAASQVAANLGVAVLASVLLGLPHSGHASAMRLAIAAALAEAAADTLSSEFGEVLGGRPRLLTTFRSVPAGTDGAVSVAGTLAGIIGAAIVVVPAFLALNFALAQSLIVTLAAIVGLFTDSLLGAVFERRGRLNNDAVNFLSTLVAALLAVLAAH